VPEQLFQAVIIPHLGVLEEDKELVRDTLKKKQTDLLTRWWLLCRLADGGRKVRLYASREEALLSLRAVKAK
jgi:hypothetical protein